MNTSIIPFVVFQISIVCLNTQYAYAHHYITDYETHRDANAITALIKSDWHKLIGLPEFNQPIVHQMLFKKRPGDYNHQDKQLYIKVLYDNQTLAGFVTYYFATSTVAFIELLVIDKQFRNRGYAKELIEHVMKEIKKSGARELDLYVFTSNPKALEMYEHLGFAIKYRFQGYICMEKLL